MCEVVSCAHERQGILLTTNLPFENWTETLGNERMIGALLDRVTHRVHITEANGESYRLKDAKRRAEPQRRENSQKTSPSRKGSPTVLPKPLLTRLHLPHQHGDIRVTGTTNVNGQPLQL